MHGCSTVLHLCLLRVEEQEETLVNFHLFAHAHYTKLSHVCTKMAKLNFKSDTIIRLSLDDTEVSQQMAFILLGHHCISFMNISSKFCKTLQLPRSSGNRHTNTHTVTDTQTDYCNPLPTLGLIIISTIQ